jgi:beta-glucosidase
MVWSLTDNFDRGGNTPRFGLYIVDALRDPELKRVPTAAVDAYRVIIGEDSGWGGLSYGDRALAVPRPCADAYRPAWADCMFAIRSSICRVRCGREI